MERSASIALVIALIATANPAEAATYYSRAGGNWNTAGNWSQVTYGGVASATYPGQLAAGDIVYISGHTITVTTTPPFAVAGITLNQLGAAATTKLDLNTAGIVLTCTGFTMVDNNVNNDMELEISSTARLQVNGAVNITRSTTNTRNKRERVYVRGTGRLTCTGNFTYTYNRSGGESEYEILLDNTGRIDVGGNLSCTIGNNAGGSDVLNLQMNNTSIVSVTGTTLFDILNTTDGDRISFDQNGGSFSSTGSITFRTQASATGSSYVDVQVDGASLSTNGNLNFTHANGTYQQLFLNSNSTATATTVTVGGDLVMNHTGGTDAQIQLNDNATMTIGHDALLTWTETNADHLTFDINGGTFHVLSDLTAAVNGGGTQQRLQFLIDGTGTFDVDGLMSVNLQSGGPFYIQTNSAAGTGATFNVDGDLVITHATPASHIEVDGYQNSTIRVGNDFTVSHAAAGGNHLWIRPHDNCTFIVGRDLLLTMTSGATNSQDDIVVRIYGGTTSIGRDVVLNKSAGDEAYWNQDGGNATVGRDFTFRSTGGDDCWMYMDNNASLSIGRNVLFDMQGGTRRAFT